MYEEQEIKYLKKKYGNISKANKKSDHKHQYDKIVIFQYKPLAFPEPVWNIGVYYCSICGKIGKQVEDRFPFGWKWTKEQWLEKYPDAICVDLEKGVSWIMINNINEVI